MNAIVKNVFIPDFVGLCLRSFKKAYSIGEPVISFDGGRPHIDNEWYCILL